MTHKKRFLRIVAFIVLTFLFSVTMMGRISDAVFHLVSGKEYMDKTFVYTIEDIQSLEKSMVMCAEKNAPTYDAKKGLMTWVDYTSYQLEEIFTNEASKHIRAILMEAGPQKDPDQVVNHLRETLGMTSLTYDEVVSAMQYAIWFYSDNDFRIPSTSNGEDLYRHFVSLEGKTSEFKTDFVQVVVDEIKRNNEKQVIIVKYHYSGNDKASLKHAYSKDLFSLYKAKESISNSEGTTYVTLTMPITANELKINFDISVTGTLKEATQMAAFVPEKRGSAQILVGYLRQSNRLYVDEKKAQVNYQAYELILNDDGEQVKRGFTDGTVVTLEMIESLNPTGKNGYIFDGWFEENRKMTTEVIMNKNRRLDSQYHKDTSPGGETPGGNIPDENVPGNNSPGGGTPTGNTPGDSTPGSNNPNGNTPEGSTPNGNTPEGSTPNGNTPGNNTPDGGTPGGDNPEELIEDPEIPEDVPAKLPPIFTKLTEWPKTGGIPLIMFLVFGTISISIGILFRRDN